MSGLWRGFRKPVDESPQRFESSTLRSVIIAIIINMDFKIIQESAIAVREKYNALEIKQNGKAWTNEQLMQGFVGDIGDLMKLVMAKEGVREIENVDEKLAHELSDCLWCVIVLANKYGVDLENAFMKTMEELDERINQNNNINSK